MGRKFSRYKEAVYRAQVQEEARESQTRREASAETARFAESYLGTPEQVAGTGPFAVDPRVASYMRRYDQSTPQRGRRLGRGD